MSYNSHRGKDIGYNNNYNQFTGYNGNQNGNNNISNTNLAANKNIPTRRQQLCCDHCKILDHAARDVTNYMVIYLGTDYIEGKG